jgi:hypothetical protein
MASSTDQKDKQREASSSRTSESSGSYSIKVDLGKALLGGGAAAVIALVGIWVVGHLSGAEARALTEATLPRLHTLCNTVILASSTILALMLTLLGLSTGSNIKLKAAFYERIQQLSLLVVIVFGVAMLVFLLLNIPIMEADKVAASWFETIYYVAVICSSVLGGALVTVMITLYHTVHGLIEVVGLGVEDHALTASTPQHEDEA